MASEPFPHLLQGISSSRAPPKKLGTVAETSRNLPLEPAKTLPERGEDETCLALVDAVYPPDAAAAESWSRKVALLVFLGLALADALLPEQGTRRRVRSFSSRRATPPTPKSM